jgi:TatD DNase family protein
MDTIKNKENQCIDFRLLTTKKEKPRFFLLCQYAGTALRGGFLQEKYMFDIGVNLTSSRFDQDRDAVLLRAREAGVNGMLLTGTSVAESEAALALALRYPSCWSTAGVHPHDASRWSDEGEQRLRQLAAHPRVVAIGECGLDYNRNYSTPQAQKRAFSAQLALAAELSMPVFLHCREAHSHFIKLLDPWLDKLPGAVLHCFTGTSEEARACLERGLFLGITGWVCDERRGLGLRALLPTIPAQRLMLETDAPWLLARDIKPKPVSRRNEPAFLAHILTQVAGWRGEDKAWLEQTIDENVRRLFGVVF